MKTTRTCDNVLCVIPARAGSVGIKDKNLQLIWGIPLVEHSILHALDAGLDPKNIIVSSDSEEIRHYAWRNKVVAQDRPASISGSSSSTEETLLWAYEHHLLCCKNHDLKPCDHILLLQATSPIRFKGTINKFLDFYLDSEYDSALTTTKLYNFFWWIHFSTKVGSSYTPSKRPMRQKLTDEADFRHFDNGNAYLTSRQVLEEKKCRLGGNVGLFPISELEGMQIDTPEDLEIFRAVFSGGIPEKVGLK